MTKTATYFRRNDLYRNLREFGQRRQPLRVVVLLCLLRRPLARSRQPAARCKSKRIDVLTLRDRRITECGSSPTISRSRCSLARLLKTNRKRAPSVDRVRGRLGEPVEATHACSDNGQDLWIACHAALLAGRMLAPLTRITDATRTLQAHRPGGQGNHPVAAGLPLRIP
jgi:hypothetical protein